jgi:hypothetical protein
MVLPMGQRRIRSAVQQTRQASKKNRLRSEHALLPKYLFWILGAIVVAGMIAKIIHQIKHH